MPIDQAADHIFGLVLIGAGLERARYSDVGIPAARAISRKKFLHHDLAMGRDIGSARIIP